MGVACSMYGREERCIQGFVGKPEVKRPLGKPRLRWEDNIKMNFREIVRQVYIVGWCCSG